MLFDVVDTTANDDWQLDAIVTPASLDGQF